MSMGSGCSPCRHGQAINNHCQVGEVEQLLKAIKTIKECQDGIITRGKTYLTNDGPTEYILHEMKKCFQLAQVYSQVFSQLQVNNLKEMDKVIKHCFCEGAVRDCYEELLDNEKEWESILRKLDLQINQKRPSVDVGQPGPLDEKVVIVQTGIESTLKDIAAGQPLILELFDSLDVKIVVVSFGDQIGAEKWIEDTQCPFDLVLDKNRKIYHTFGLSRSFSQVWNFSFMVYYAEQIRAGRKLPKPYDGLSDDPMQMGGDFMLDHKGTVIMLRPSKTPDDRPKISDLLSNVNCFYKECQSSTI